MTRDGLQDLMDRMQVHHVEQIALLQERFSETTEAQHQRFSQEAEALQARFNAEVMAQQQRFNQSILSLQQHCSGLQAGMNNVQQSYSDALTQTEQVKAELNASLGNAHHWYLRAISYEQQLQAVHHSVSWRVTEPLRAVVKALHWLCQSGKSKTDRALRKVAPHARLWIVRRPAIQRPVIAFLDRNPRLTAKLRQLYQQAAQAEALQNAADPQHGVIDHAPLTERGRHIECALMQAMTKDQN